MKPRWVDVEQATLADVDGYYFLGHNAEWSDPKVRVGFYDHWDEKRRFRLIGGPHMELGPTHVARLPETPNA